MISDVPVVTVGGDEESRTPDLLLAKQALYQLSYGPIGERSFDRL